jgi:hypothetical protein
MWHKVDLGATSEFCIISYIALKEPSEFQSYDEEN